MSVVSYPPKGVVVGHVVPSVRRAAPLAAAALLSLLAAGCGSDGDPADESKEPSVAKGSGTDVSGACPSAVVVQASWLPSTTDCYGVAARKV
jgi:hypothetical protein